MNEGGNQALMSRAQTNFQLYRQLQGAGYSEAELVLIRNAYELAMRLFTGQFRGNGAPFLCHLVGTASILAKLKAAPAIVAAGLLHSAYSFGEFGCGTRTMTEGKREQVRAAGGADAESLVARYTALPWTQASIQAAIDHPGDLTDEERTVFLMRLSNEVDDNLDHSSLYSRKAEDMTHHPSAHLMSQIARALGYGSLAGALSEVFRDCRSASVPEYLKSPRTSSFLLAPASHRLRPMLRLKALVRSYLARLTPRRD